MTAIDTSAPTARQLREWLLEALQAEGHAGELADEHVQLASGIGIDAEFGEALPREQGGVRIASRTLAWHPAFPEGLMEYQHATGDDVRAACLHGFRQWARLDLVALQELVPGADQRCLHLDMAFPGTDGAPAHRRRVVCGPAARFGGSAHADDPDHPFCPCCLFTRGLDAFRPLLDADEVLGVRLFAARNADGTFEADCRVNGEDYPDGVEALRAYAATWPGTGFEFRKQYVIVCTPAGQDAPAP
jgi:hypothetical protein